jgi:hypothetical protein
LIDELLAGARTPEEITGPDGLLQRLTKRLVERAMAAELTEYLGVRHAHRGVAGIGGRGREVPAASCGMSAECIVVYAANARMPKPRYRATPRPPPGSLRTRPRTGSGDRERHRRPLRPGRQRPVMRSMCSARYSASLPTPPNSPDLNVCIQCRPRK